MYQTKLTADSKSNDPQNKDKEQLTEQLSDANRELEKTRGFLNELVNGIQEMIFMTSHKVRQPIVNILGISNMIDGVINSPAKLRRYLKYIKLSALKLDSYTKELTTFMCSLGQKDKRR